MKRVAILLALLAALALSGCTLDTLSKTHTATAFIDAQYQDADPVEIELVIEADAAIRLRGGGEQLLGGEATFDVESWEPAVTQEGGVVRVEQGVGASGTPPRDFENTWNLRLGDQYPLALRVEMRDGDGRWNLGGQPITGLSFAQDAGESLITFADPVTATMEAMTIEGGAARLDVRDLLNANPADLEVIGGAGAMTLEFTGGPAAQRTRANIEGGAGPLYLIIDEDAPVRIEVIESAGELIVTDELVRRAGGFETEAFAQAGDGPTVTIDLVAGRGTVDIDTR
jgi:hypothetical protein